METWCAALWQLFHIVLALIGWLWIDSGPNLRWNNPTDALKNRRDRFPVGMALDWFIAVIFFNVEALLARKNYSHKADLPGAGLFDRVQRR